ncbi:MAG: CoA pyrophosphatase [Romboutsia sp.]
MEINIKKLFKDYKPYINDHKSMKKYAVLIPIVNIDNTNFILFEVRSKTLNSQPNEISFPGGKIEYGETPKSACIRETCEELGTINTNIEIISELDLFVNHAQMIIHPFIGVVKNFSSLVPNIDEVDHVFLVPLTHLIQNNPVTYKNEVKVIPHKNFPYELIPHKENYKFQSGYYDSLFYTYKNYVIWGITAKILENFLNIISPI